MSSGDELASCKISVPKKEDYQWSDTSNEKDLDIQKKYIKYPFHLWENLIKDKVKDTYDEIKIYAETVNDILEKDIFNGENFKRENTINNIFAELMTEKKISNKIINENSIKPDFIVMNLDTEKFINIINTRNYMFRYDKKYLEFIKKNKINILGEIKTNAENINKNQKKMYLEICKKLNDTSENDLYLILYVFDFSYKIFWNKNFFNKSPIVIAYIPKLFKNEYLTAYNNIMKNSNDENIKNAYEKKQEKYGDLGNEINEENEKDVKREEIGKRNDIDISEIIEYNERDEENIDKEIFSKKKSKIKIDNNNIYHNLLNKKRNKEDKIIKMERNYADDKEKFEEEIKEIEKKREEEIKEIEKKREEEIKEIEKKREEEIKEIEKKREKEIKEKKRNNEDILVSKKRQIEDEKLELKIIENKLNKIANDLEYEYSAKSEE